MKEKVATAITPTRSQDYPEWYQQVIRAADLAEPSPVRGCMVIKPWGYALWERIQQVLDGMFKETGHVNAYFPLLIPLSFLEKEAAHVEGFAKECAVVTHHRLEAGPDGKLIPKGELEEPFVIRPTSETIIGASYAKWVRSYRDLPILINQWANVMRWEMRTRMFLRTAEFLWQEGHTAHTNAEEAMEETLRMLDVYAKFAEEYMAMPVIKGEKTPNERFPGALNTYAIEAMMQDNKALQAGTSHFLGQNFSRASGIKFQSKEGTEELAWTTSWGVSTRLIGGLIMTHSDDDGLVLPPRMAPRQVVIMPIYRNDDEHNQVLEYCKKLRVSLQDLRFGDGQKVLVDIDDRDIRGGEKAWYHIKRGVPIRLEIGPRDLASDSIFMGRRDAGPREKSSIPRTELLSRLPSILDEMQTALFEKARRLRDSATVDLKSEEEFKDYFSEKPGSAPGFGYAFWFYDEAQLPLFKELKVTARCIPLQNNDEEGLCIFSGRPVRGKVIFAKAY